MAGNILEEKHHLKRANCTTQLIPMYWCNSYSTTMPILHLKDVRLLFFREAFEFLNTVDC